jgi:hypothetical protein
MRNLYTLLTLAALAVPVTAQADKVTVFGNGASSSKFNILEGVALNVTAASRTITLDLCNLEALNTKRACYTKLTVHVFYTYSAATTLTGQFTCSVDGTNYTRKVTKSCSSGTCTVYNKSDSYTTSGASINQAWEYDVRGCAKVKVLFGGASADGSDLVNVQAVAIKGAE